MGIKSLMQHLMPEQNLDKIGDHMHRFDDTEPTVTFLCEQCKREFDVEGTVERTDDEGGLEFIPSINGTTKQVYCPNDFAWGFGEPPVHEISLGA